MTKRSKKRIERFAATSPASSQDIIHPNATLGPEASFEPSTGVMDFADSTSINNPADEKIPETYASTPIGFLDKYFFSGKRNLPIIQIAFVVFLLAVGGIVIQDNGSGALQPGDWRSIGWTFLKCALLSFLVLFALIGYNLITRMFKTVDKK